MFNGRVFLYKYEWMTYKRRKPVRYIKFKKDYICKICNLYAQDKNKLQNAHIIGFSLGIIQLGLTPEFLDSSKNIVTAHKTTCNKMCELNLYDSIQRLYTLDIINIPQYLSKHVQKIWYDILKKRTT